MSFAEIGVMTMCGNRDYEPTSNEERLIQGLIGKTYAEGESTHEEAEQQFGYRDLPSGMDVRILWPGDVILMDLMVMRYLRLPKRVL